MFLETTNFLGRRYDCGSQTFVQRFAFDLLSEYSHLLHRVADCVYSVGQ